MIHTQLHIEGMTAPEKQSIESEAFRIKFETGKPFQIKTPDGDLSREGISALNTYLYDQSLDELPTEFEYVWTTKRGTLPKRVQSHFYKAHGVKLTTEQISEIGNLAKRHASLGITYTLDFTGSIDWEAGDFGDGGSCFWGDRESAKEMIEENGYALRAFRQAMRYPEESALDYRNLRGYARCWIAPIGSDRLIVFNGYGETSLLFARLLSMRFSCGYQRIHLLNHGSDDSTLYINGGTGFMVGQFAKIHSVASWDLEWADTGSCYSSRCACGNDMTDDESYTLLNGDVACGDCSTDCDRCGEWFLRRNTILEDDRRYCLPCWESVSSEREAKLAMEEI